MNQPCVYLWVLYQQKSCIRWHISASSCQPEICRQNLSTPVLKRLEHRGCPSAGHLLDACRRASATSRPHIIRSYTVSGMLARTEALQRVRVRRGDHGKMPGAPEAMRARQLQNELPCQRTLTGRHARPRRPQRPGRRCRIACQGPPLRRSAPRARRPPACAPGCCGRLQAGPCLFCRPTATRAALPYSLCRRTRLSTSSDDKIDRLDGAGAGAPRAPAAPLAFSAPGRRRAAPHSCPLDIHPTPSSVSASLCLSCARCAGPPSAAPLSAPAGFASGTSALASNGERGAPARRPAEVRAGRSMSALQSALVGRQAAAASAEALRLCWGGPPFGHPAPFRRSRASRGLAGAGVLPHGGPRCSRSLCIPPAPADANGLAGDCTVGQLVAEPAASNGPAPASGPSPEPPACAGWGGAAACASAASAAAGLALARVSAASARFSGSPEAPRSRSAERALASGRAAPACGSGGGGASMASSREKDAPRRGRHTAPRAGSRLPGCASASESGVAV